MYKKKVKDLVSAVAASVATPLVVATVGSTLRILPILVLILVTCNKLIEPERFYN